MQTIVAFNVNGIRPTPQGSKRHVGNGRMIEQAGAALKAYRRAIVLASAPHRPQTPLCGPVHVRLVIQMPRPGSHFGSGKNAGALKPSAPQWIDAYPLKRGDVDKLERATLDALTTSRIYHDDSQVTDLHTSLLFAPPGGGYTVRVCVAPVATDL